MDRLLSLSQAARMVGVPRKLLQQHIQEGRLTAFEGHIRMSELHKAYPEADSDRSGMVEKVQRIRDAALYKANRDGKPDVDHLSSELQRTRVEIARLQDEIASYRELTAETEERLLALQEQCDARQAMMLGTLVGWFMNQLKLREAK
jgi:chromosome segregation ATPase